VLDLVPGLYERAARWRPGTVSRAAWVWPRILKDASEPTEASYGKGSFVAVHTDADGIDDGYVFYDVDWNETFAENPVGAGKVRDLWGSSPAVELALWRFLLDIDLITTWRADVRPVDEPVRRAMHDFRAYEVRQRIDDQWVRILDVDAALCERRFAPAAGEVTLTVHDPMFADNCGSWTLSTGGAVRAERGGDLVVDIAALSAAYLGAVSWRDLVVAGAVAGNVDDDTIAMLDNHFAVRPTPFCGTGY
jgi:predicted acetyltransferase